MINQIHYWHGILSNPRLAAYQGTIAKLLTGDYKAADLDLKQLPGARIFSVRVNDSDRLLFTTIKKGGKSYLAFLEEILNHDYSKSRFLQRHVLANFLAKNDASFTAQIEEKDFIPVINPDLPINEDPAPPQIVPLYYYNQQLIELNINQQTALKTSLPVIIRGGAGTGKTCAAIGILTELLDLYLEKSPQGQLSQMGQELDKQTVEPPILYVAQSEKLVKTMAVMWRGNPAANKVLEGVIQFKTYKQVVEEVVKEKLTFLTPVDCMNWLREHWRKERDKLKNTPHTEHKMEVLSIIAADPAKVYQEFRIIAGVAQRYLHLGERQSLFHHVDQRNYVLDAYNAYNKSLKPGEAHLDFLTLPKRPLFQFVINDEGQDLSPVCISNLYGLAIDQQFVCLVDTHQSLFGSLSIMPFLTNLLRGYQKNPNYIELTHSYRCPGNAIRLANRVIDIKHHLTGLVDKDEIEKLDIPADAKDGNVCLLFSNLSPNETTSLQQRAKNNNFAIITSAEYREEAIILFDTPLVFTPEEIKGLEFTSVLTYRLLEKPIFRTVNNYLIDNPFYEKQENNRPKANQSENAAIFTLPFNEIYTAFTRTTDELIIYEVKKIHALTTFVKTLICVIETKAPTPLPTATASNREEWLDTAKNLLAAGKTQQANAILNTYNNNATSTSLKNKPTRKAQEKLPVIMLQQPLKLLPPVANVIPPLPTTKANNKTKNKADPKKPAPTPAIKISEKDKRQLRQWIMKSNAIATIFQSPQRNKWLFKVPLLNKPNLMLHIFADDNRIFALEDAMEENSQYIAVLDANDLYQCLIYNASANNNSSTFLHYLSDFETPRTLELLFFNLRALFKKITPEDLCRLQSKDSNNEPTSVLYNLSINSRGRRILNNWVEENESSVCKISVESLYHAPPKLSLGKYESAFYFLTQKKQGRNVLLRLFTLNPDLLNHLQTVYLTQSRMYFNPEYELVSLLYILSNSRSGRVFLLKLVKMKPSILTSIALEELCEVCQKPNDEQNTSPFFNLSESSDTGKELLALFIDANPTLIATMKAADLYRKLLATSPDDEGTSIFYNLCNPDRYKILEKLFTANPQLVVNMTETDLYSLIPNSNIHVAGQSPFYNLCAFEEGKKLLLNIYKANPQLCIHLKREHLFYIRTDRQDLSYESNPNPIVFPYSQLTSTQLGCTIFQEMLTINPALAEEINIEDLTRRLSTHYHNYPTLIECWGTSNSGRELLGKLLHNNHKIASSFSISLLCSPVSLPSLPDNTPPASLISQIAGTQQEMIIIGYLYLNYWLHEPNLESITTLTKYLATNDKLFPILSSILTPLSQEQGLHILQHQDSNGDTLLHIAAANNNMNAIKFILQYKSFSRSLFELKNNKGESVLELLNHVVVAHQSFASIHQNSEQQRTTMNQPLSFFYNRENQPVEEQEAITKANN